MTILSRNEIGTPFSPPRLLLAADESGIVSVNRALWRTSHAPMSLHLIVLLPLYAPHGKLHPKIVQRYRIRFFSSCSLPLPDVICVHDNSNCQTMRLPPVGFFLCKVSASGILQGSALHALSQIIFQENGVRLLLFHFPKPQG